MPLRQPETTCAVTDKVGRKKNETHRNRQGQVEKEIQPQDLIPQLKR